LKGVCADTALRRSVRDPKAFAELYDAESDALLLFLARRTLDGQTALDVCAETLGQAFAGRKRFRGLSDEEARAFLYVIAQRQLSRFWRRGAVERGARARLGSAVCEYLGFSVYSEWNPAGEPRPGLLSELRERVSRSTLGRRNDCR
jgi:DNA-directed RNA polymerase specialized sigma24 family protein